MKREMEIVTGAFEKPYRTVGIYDESAVLLKIVWQQKDDNDSVSRYEIKMDKETGVAIITRKGEISSRLVFDTGKNTSGELFTPYGTINIDIRTEYINMPSVLSPKFEICYYMSTFEEENKNNIFSVNLLLQK